MDLKFSRAEIIIFITSFLTFKIYTSYPSFIYKDSATSAWIVVILSTLIMLLIWWIFWSFLKKYSCGNFLSLMQRSFGRKLYFILTVILVLYVFASLSLWTFNSVGIIKLAFYERSPMIFVLLFYILTSVYGASVGMRPIIIASSATFVFVILSLISLIFGSSEYYGSYTNLFPAMGLGVKNTIIQSLIYTNIFDDFIFFIFTVSFDNKKEDIYRMGNIVILTSGILIFIFTVIYQILVPYPTGGTYIFPYEELSRVSVNNTFSVFLNFILIFVIISGFFVYISYKLHFISVLLSSILKPYMKNISYRKLALPVGILLAVTCLLQKDILRNLDLLYANRLIALVFAFIFPLITFISAKIRGVDMS